MVNAAIEHAAPATGQSSAPPSGVDIRSVWLLTNAPSPYQSELLSAISDREDIKLDVRFLQSGSPAGRASANRYSSRVMTSILPPRVAAELQFHPRAVWECAVGRWDCYVLSGLYTSVTFLMCAAVLTLRRARWVVWFERPHSDSRSTSRWSLRRIASRVIRGVGTLVRRLVLGSAHRVICIGTAARDEYASRGVPGDRLDVLPYCCDIDRFAAVPPREVEAVKDRLSLDGKVVCLFSGQMIERKGVDTVIAAFEKIAPRCPDAVLLLLGDGPLRPRYEGMIPQWLRGRVSFLGHIPQDDLPAHFAAADLFVFPSRHDGWGVVVNEACAARLPVITTYQTGAAHDLVEHEKSGFVFDRDDVDGFATAMQFLIEHPDERNRFGERSRELVEQFSPGKGAARFQRAVTAACRA